MRVLTLRLLVVCLIWAMTPGLMEASENLWHLLVHGHVAHAQEEGSDHEPEGDEHGCSGIFHLCTCHHSPPTALPVGAAAGQPAPVDHAAHRVAYQAPSPDLPGLFRPPRV